MKSREVINPPQDMQQIELSRIDVKTQEGEQYDNIMTPPSEVSGTNIVATSMNNKKDASDEIPFHADIQTSFPGGVKGWLKYVRRAIEKELNEFTDEYYGTCIIRYMADKRSTVSEVASTTMKGSKLAGIAVKAIRNGPVWIPAQPNGHFVNADRLQPVTLKKAD